MTEYAFTLIFSTQKSEYKTLEIEKGRCHNDPVTLQHLITIQLM